jgi:co-chaperonin GroES (HSP10)
MRSIQLFSDVILVRVDSEEILPCGLYAPPEAQPGHADIAESHALNRTGEVLQVGPGRKSTKTFKPLPMSLAPGDRIVFSAWVGTPIPMQFGWPDNVLMMRDSEVLTKVESMNLPASPSA